MLNDQLNFISVSNLKVTKELNDMGLQDKAKAAVKKVQGKVQETAGDMTDNHEAQAKGKAKQTEAEMSDSVEEVKDKTKDAID